MRKLAIAVAVLLLLVAAAVVVAPRLIDWNRYRPDVAGRLQAALGRGVEINGDLSLSLVPVPALSVGQVRLANVPGAAEPYMATIEAVRLRLAPAALLRGGVSIRSLVLVKPVVHFQTFADGRSNWQFDAPAGLPAKEGGDEAGPPAAVNGGVSVQIEELVVEDGVIVFQQPAGEAIRVDDVDGTFSAATMEGPFQAAGRATWHGVEAEYEGSAGRLAGNGAAPFSLAVRLPEKRAEARMAGQVALAGSPEVRGRLTVTAGSLAEVMALAPGLGTPPAALAKPFAAEGVVEAKAAQIDVNDMSVRLGDMEGKGALGMQLGDRPAADVALVFNRLDVDTLAAAAERGKGGPPGEPPGPPSAGEEVAEFVLPTGFALTADLAADIVVYRGSIIRQAKLEAGLDGGVLSVRRATALLPGGSDVSVVANLRQADGRLAVDGAFEASSDNLRAVLQWLGVQIAEISADRLRQFSADGKLRGTLSDLQISDLDLRLDTSRLRGAANLRLVGRLAVGANLVIDNLNVDAYRSVVAARPDVAIGGPRAGGEAPAGGAPFDAFDANVKARIEMLTMNEVSLHDVLVDGSLVRGDLTLRQASVGDFGGASARASGIVANLAAGPMTLRDFAYDIRTRQPAKILRLLRVQPGFDASRLGAVALRGSADGPLENLTLSSRLDIAGGAVALDGTIGAVGATPSFDVAFTASHPSFADLLRVFAPDYRPAGRLGAVATSARMQGRGLSVAADDLLISVGDARVSGRVTVDLVGEPKITARLDADAVVVDEFLPPQRAALLRPPSDWLVAPTTPQPVATRVVSAPERRLGVAAAAGGNPPWSREPLDLGWLEGISADLALTAKAVTYGKYRLESLRTAAKVADDTAVLESLTAALFGGALAVEGRLASDGAASGTVTIEDARLRQALSAGAGIDLASGSLSATANFATRGASPFDLAANLGGKGQVAVHDGVIQGFDLAEVSGRLTDIDNAGSLLGLLQAGMTGGETRFSSLTATFAGEQGILTSRDISLQADAGQGQGGATVNLPAYMVDGRMGFTLSAHPDMPPFGLRLEGPLDNPRRVFETNELQAWLVGKGVGRLLEGKGGEAGKVIEQLLGGGQTGRSPQPQPPADPSVPSPAAPPSDKVRPEDVLKELMQQFGR